MDEWTFEKDPLGNTCIHMMDMCLFLERAVCFSSLQPY